MLMGFLIRQWLLRSGFTEFSAPAGNSSRILWWAPIINPLHCGKEGFRHTKNCTLNYKPQIYVGFSVMTFGHQLLATVRTKGSIKEPTMWSFNQVVDIIWLWTVLRDYYWGLPRHAGWVGLNEGCMLPRLDNTKVQVWLNVRLKAIWQEIINQYLLARGILKNRSQHREWREFCPMSAIDTLCQDLLKVLVMMKKDSAENIINRAERSEL